MTEVLLACLKSRANRRGIAIVAESTLLSEIRADRESVVAELEKLERAGLIEILTPLPFLVARLPGKWPGRGANTSISSHSAYSYSKLLQTKQLKNSYRRESQTEETSSTLLQEILETLGESDPSSFERAVQLYSPQVVRTALDRVRRAKGIRKSRTALFRHLLPRLARENHHSD
jgi:hypothetical protein